MKKDAKIVRFVLPEIKPEVTITHGYNIQNNFPVHFHRTFSLGLIESGNRMLLIRGVKYKLKKGDVFIIQPYEPHSIVQIGTNGHTYKMISFDFSELSRCFFCELVIRDESLSGLLLKLHNQTEYNFVKEDLMNLLNKIKSILINHVVPEEQTKSTEHESINEAKKYIENNFRSDISLDDIAAEACLSPYHFSRLFHKKTGMSPYAYLIFCRVKEAQQMIDSDSDLLEAAIVNGFFDQSHFGKTFKKHVGVTPKIYQDNIK